MRLPTPIALLSLVPPFVGSAPAQEAETVPLLPLHLTWKPTQEAVPRIPADRPDLHAPIGVLADHLQPKDGLEISYRYVRTEHDGLLDGDDEVSEEEVFGNLYGEIGRGYQQAPQRLRHAEHRFSAEYGYDEDLTLLFTVPWISNDMRSVTRDGEEFDTHSKGLGDLRLTGLWSLRREPDRLVHVNLGLSFPTGSRDARDETPSTNGEQVKLPYPMQLGSGTFDLLPGLTYLRVRDNLSWGAQVTQTVRLGENSDGYTLGGESDLTAWIARAFQDDLSGSFRVSYHHAGDADGEDRELDPELDPAADPGAQGGERIDAFLGLSYAHSGGHLFAAEIGGPLFQDLNGPQLEASIVYAVGWQFSF